MSDHHIAPGPPAAAAPVSGPGWTAPLARAREILGLEDLGSFPGALPVRAEQLWRMDRFAAHIPFTNPMFVPMGQVSDLGLLFDAVAAVVSRHEALRTRLSVRQGRGVQIPEDWNATHLECVDIRRSELLDDRPDSKSAVSEFTQISMNLYAQEGFRCRAFRDEERNLTLGFLAHGFFSDAWSSQVLLREVRAAYAALGAGQAPECDPALQYSQYALAQRHALAKDLAPRLTYWHEKLADMPPSPLPYDHSGAVGRRGRSYFFVTQNIVARLLAVADANRLSLTLVLMAAYQLALARWSGADAILSAAYTADRVKPEFRNTIGFLVTNMPVCARIDRDDDFPSFLRGFARDFYAGYAHRDLSCELYEAILRPEKPFCASVFNFVPLQKNFFASELHAVPDFEGTIMAPDAARPAIYRDLYLGLAQYPNGILGKLFYNAGAFTPDSMEVFIRNFRHVAGEIAADPSQRLKSLLR
jgi:hypothetical protein